MKPSWSDAPEWANYLAMDSNDEWYWFEKEPIWDGSSWTRGRMEFAPTNATLHEPSTSLESRPDLEKHTTAQCPVSWEHAPTRAQWLAMDKNGEWFWYVAKPYCGSVDWTTSDSYMSFTGVTSENAENWQNSLQKRPGG